MSRVKNIRKNMKGHLLETHKIKMKKRTNFRPEISEHNKKQPLSQGLEYQYFRIQMSAEILFQRHPWAGGLLEQINELVFFFDK